MAQMNKIKTFFSILILVVFCGFLFIGYLFVNSETVLTSERRKVTGFHMLTSLKKQEIKDFFSRLDLFIADRLLFKDRIFKTVSALHADYFFDFDISKAVKGKENWYFIGNSFGRVIDKHTADIPSPGRETLAHIQEMAELKEFAGSLDSAFFYVICPDKHGIYHEYLPDYLAGKNHEEHRYVNKVIPLLRADKINVIDLYSIIKSSKQAGNLYYRTDTHWNMLGASIGFDEIYRTMEVKLPDGKLKDMARLPKYSLEKIPSTNGDLVSIGGFYSAALKDDDNYALVYKPDSGIVWKIDGKEQTGPVSKGKLINNAKAGNPIGMHNPNAINKMKLVVIGDSFFEALSPFFNASFSDIVYITHAIPVQDKKHVIRKFRPDVVVYETVERYI